MQTVKQKQFYQYIFCLKMLIMQKAEITIQRTTKSNRRYSPILIRKIKAIRGSKKYERTIEFREQYGDIISMFSLANIFIYCKGKVYSLPTILCMETHQGIILTEKEIISEGKEFYENTLKMILETISGTQKVKLYRNENNVQCEILEE